ncbi:MAG: ribulokinase [Planctomycetes bacterium]|nr:ribulokinase [Planctomycetota bacterium]
MARMALGLDFGTESARALLLDIESAAEVGEGVAPYPHGVLDHNLPTGEDLPRDWALQHPTDWTDAAARAIREALAGSGARREDLVAVGVDFTASTPLPVTAGGDPLCLQARWAREPHAWPKLWKHHGAKEEAARINALARKRAEPFLAYYGGVVGLEWLLPKAWQVLREAPAVYAAADRFLEGGDWLVWRLTGRETRNACAAGYKALWTARHGFPSPRFLAALDPELARFYRDKVQGEIVAPGRAVGAVTPLAAAQFGLPAGIPVSAAVIDAHAGVPGAGVGAPGTMVIILGTSSCHLLLSREARFFAGFAGLVADGILPGFHGYESGQAAVGDIFAWYLAQAVPAAVRDAARAAGRDLHDHLAGLAARLAPGSSGLVALDWHQGNRSVLMDGRLSGVLLGLTLQTRPEEIYRALLEATAFGTRVIVESYVAAGLPVERIVACGGLARKNPLLMQLHADILGRPIDIAASDQTVARGAAIFGALAAEPAAREPADVAAAVARLGAATERRVTPDPRAGAVYDRLYALYRRLHDHFGRDAREIMHELRALAAAAGPPARGD